MLENQLFLVGCNLGRIAMDFPGRIAMDMEITLALPFERVFLSLAVNVMSKMTRLQKLLITKNT